MTEESPSTSPIEKTSRLSSFFDSHAHLDQAEFDSDRQTVVHRAREAGVAEILCPAVSIDSAERILQLADSFNLLVALGIHPNSAAEAAPDAWHKLAALVDHPRVVALGETGLDRYWDYTPLKLQQEFFARHLSLAQEKQVPVIVHCRDAAADVLTMLKEAAARGPIQGVIHAFSGDALQAEEYLALGFYISFAGNVTYPNKKFSTLREVAKIVPDDRLLIETDSPYLVPQVFRGRHQRNEPANVVYVAAELAKLRNTTLEEIARLTTANALRLFAIKNRK